MKYTMTFCESEYEKMCAHLLPDHAVERAGYLFCRLSRTDSEIRLLVRSFEPVAVADIEEASDSHMKIRSQSFRRAMKRADERRECFVFVHSHPEHVPHHSYQDDCQERELFRTAYNRIHHNAVHASLVVSSPERPCGRVWLEDGSVVAMDVIRVIGRRFRFYRNGEVAEPTVEYFDRQVRAFGEANQQQLRMLCVGVVGLGGTGSAVAQQLARMGVGKLILSDGEDFDRTNVNRVYGSRVVDHDVAKVKIAERAIAEMGLGTTVVAIQRPVTFRSVLRDFRECDVIFGCTDEEWGRALLCSFATYYCIPVFDMGVRIRSEDGVIQSVQGRVTTLMPSRACLYCRRRISAEQVRFESMQVLNPAGAQALRDEGYAPELREPAPSVVSLTSAVASSAVTEFLHRMTGFLGNDRVSSEVLLRFDDTKLSTNDAAPQDGCACGSRYFVNRGDADLFLDTTWRSE